MRSITAFSLILALATALPLCAQPVNDGPCTAIPISVSPTCTPLVVDNTNGTLSTGIPAPGCGLLSGSDVWYSITVPVAGLFTISTSAGTITDGAMAIYAADSCDGSFTLVHCDDDLGAGSMPEILVEGAEPGALLYLRVWGYDGVEGTMDLCVTGPTVIPPGDCVYLLSLFDSYADGWGNGSYVEVMVDQDVVVSDSLEMGAQAYWLIGASYGQAIVVSYTAATEQNDDQQIQLRLMQYGAPVFLSSYDPGSGVLFTDIVDCLPPAPIAGDCGFAMPICGDTTIDGNQMNVGYIDDLTPLNQGCLAAGEQAGIWMQMRVIADGTIGLSCTPEILATDLDFAFWGPMNEVTCPPPGLPVRCSFSAMTGATGLSTAALDNTEGAGGDRWVAALPVQAGELYMIYLGDYSQSGSGAELVWDLMDGAALECLLPPVADLIPVNAQILVGGTVDFTDLSSNAPTQWAWNFQGGTPPLSAEQHPIGIQYDTPGCYDVSLIATNPAGSDQVTHLCAVEVEIQTGLEDPMATTAALVCRPNPAEDAFSIILPQGMRDQRTELIIHDVRGAIVWRGVATSVRTDLRLGLSRGVYAVVAKNANWSGTARLVVQ